MPCDDPVSSCSILTGDFPCCRGASRAQSTACMVRSGSRDDIRAADALRIVPDVQRLDRALQRYGYGLAYSQWCTNSGNGIFAARGSVFIFKAERAMGRLGVGERCSDGRDISPQWNGGSSASLRTLYRSVGLDVVPGGACDRGQCSDCVFVLCTDALDNDGALAGASTYIQLAVFAGDRLVL